MKVRYTFFGNLDEGERFKDRYGRYFTKTERVKVEDKFSGVGWSNAVAELDLYPDGERTICFNYDAVVELIE